MPVRARVLAAAALAVAAGAAVLWHEADRDGGDLVLYGNVDIRQVALAFDVAGPVAEMLLEEGEPVTEGQTLARLDTTPYRHAVAAAEARLAQRRAELAKFEAGFRRQDIGRARAELEVAEADRANALSTFERRRKLVANSDVSRQAFDDARRSLDATRARVREREEALDLAVEGYRTEDVDAARAAAEAAAAALEIERYRLGRTRLVAPTVGTVLIRHREPGAVVRADTPIYTVALADPVWVRSFVPEPALGLIHPGMAATILTDSRPDRPYDGWVGFISPTAEFTPKTVETPELRTALVYRLRIYVRNPDNGLRQGMPVTVRLDTGAADAAN